MSAGFSISDSLLHICLNSSSPATTCSYYSLYQVWQTWTYLLVFVQFVCWHPNVSRWSGGQQWRLFSFHRRKHCWCAHTSLLANFQCSHRVVLVPFCIISTLHLIVVWFLQAIWIPEWSLQWSSFFAFYVSKGRAGRSNTSIRTLYFHFAVTRSLLSTHHMQGDWYYLALPYLAQWFKNFRSSIQVFYCKTFTMFWYDSSYRCLCVQSSMSSPLHHLSYRRLNVLIGLQTPVTFS